VASLQAGTELMKALMNYYLKAGCSTYLEVCDYEMYLYNELAYLKGYRIKPLVEILQAAIDQCEIQEHRKQGFIINIMSGFYGIPFVKSLGNNRDFADNYREFLDVLFKDIGRRK